jgi:hypothetical protein
LGGCRETGRIAWKTKPIPELNPIVKKPSRRRRARSITPWLHFEWLQRLISWLRGIEQRERTLLLEETTRFRDLMPVLMKPRNGERWTREDRTQIKARLRELTELSPLLIPLVLPGGVLLLPLFVWWLDRRKRKRMVQASKK